MTAIIKIFIAALASLFVARIAHGDTPVKIGSDCTTVYFIDKDCDGYGVGVKSSGVYPLGGGTSYQPGTYTMGDKPDADDEDPSVNTTASWQAKWGSNNQGIVNFLQKRKGFTNTSRVLYVSQSGDDATGKVNDPSHPYRLTAPVLKQLSDMKGGAVIIRGGDWTDLDFRPCDYQHGNPCWLLSGSAGHPVYVMNYPGERVQTTLPWSSTTYGPYPNVGWVTMDGLSWWDPTYGGDDAISLSDTNDMTIINNEIAGWHQIYIGNHSENPVIRGNVFHDMHLHAIYFGPWGTLMQTPGQIAGQDFNFDQDKINYAAGTSRGASYGGLIQNNVLYNNGADGYEPLHINTYLTGVVIDGNIVAYSGGSPLSFQTGVYHSVVRNNVFFGNGRDAVTLWLYGDDNTAATIRWNIFENNTFYVGKHSDAIRGTNPSGGISAKDGSTGMPHRISDITVRNNIIVVEAWSQTYGNTLFSFRRNSYPDTWTIENNLIWNNAATLTPSPDKDIVAAVDSDAGGAIAPGRYTFNQFKALRPGFGSNIYANPRFTSADLSYTLTPERFNLRLQDGGPEISPGRKIGAVCDTPHSAFNVGAYQYKVPSCN